MFAFGLLVERRCAACVFAAIGLFAAAPALADPPMLTEAPPLVIDDGGVVPANEIAFTSLRGLDEPLPDLAMFGPATSLLTADTAATAAFYNGCFTLLGPGNAVVAQGAGSCGNNGAPIPPDDGAQFRDANGVAFGSAGPETFLQSFSYSLSNTQVVNTSFVGGGVQTFVRVAGIATQLATATAPTLEEATSAALIQADFGFTRGRILPAIVNPSGVIESEVINSSTTRLTGRDDFAAFLTTIGGVGPNGEPDTVIAGQRGQCAGFVNACESGLRFVVLPGASNLVLVVHTDFYTTTTIDRTVTSTGTAFVDVPIAHEGVSHAAAQTVGFALGDRFLRRLTSPGAAGFGEPAGLSDEAARWRVFLEGTGARGELTGNDRYHFQAIRGGLSRVVNPNLDLGAAFEVGNWRYKHPDAFVPERGEGDLWRLGAFARYTPGRWRLHGAVIGGEQDVETTGMSLAGAGTSQSKVRARVFGAGTEAGYAIPVDGFTLAPHARVTALRWTSPAVVESGGAAPLSIAKATREQVRLALGATLGRRYEIEPGFDLGVEIGARAFTTTGDTRGRVVASDAIAPSPFAIEGPSGERNGVEFSAGVTLVKDGRMAIAASYEGRFAGDEQSHAGILTLKMAF